MIKLWADDLALAKVFRGPGFVVLFSFLRWELLESILQYSSPYLRMPFHDFVEFLNYAILPSVSMSLFALDRTYSFPKL